MSIRTGEFWIWAYIHPGETLSISQDEEVGLSGHEAIKPRKSPLWLVGPTAPISVRGRQLLHLPTWPAP